MGNIYDRLEDARKKRERALETPHPANDDRPQLPFPKLKPPVDFPAETLPQPSFIEWAAPVLLALAIFAVIFAFAVS
jgi:hypothetical protein